MTVTEFIEKWSQSAASERANHPPFVLDLCDLLGVAQPNPSVANNALNEYVFERAVSVDLGNGSKTTNYLDCYKRGCFVLEAKQGSVSSPSGAVLRTRSGSSGNESAKQEGLFGLASTGDSSKKTGTAKRGTLGWDKAMLKAKGQAEFYVKALPAKEGRPPFVIVVDVGFSIEVYSEFSRSGGVYIPFPDPKNHRILLEDLQNPEILERLRLIWTDPLALDPTRRSAKATRAIADKLAVLAKSLERDHVTTTGAEEVISPKSNRKEQRDFDKGFYKERHLIECFFNKIKQLK